MKNEKRGVRGAFFRGGNLPPGEFRRPCGTDQSVSYEGDRWSVHTLDGRCVNRPYAQNGMSVRVAKAFLSLRLLPAAKSTSLVRGRLPGFVQDPRR